MKINLLSNLKIKEKTSVFILLLILSFTADSALADSPPIDSAVAPVPKVRKRLFPERTFVGDFGVSTGRISYEDTSDGGTLKREIRVAGVFNFTAHLFEEVYFRTTLFKQFQDKNLPPWTSDFYYILERFNWRPNTFSYGYENYTPNKYNATSQVMLERFLQGNYYISYNHNLPSGFINSLKIDNSTNWNVKYFVKYAVNYQDENSVNYGEGSVVDGKAQFGVTSRYTIGWNIYLEGALYYFPERQKSVPWDPDYTYGFGYFDWRAWKINFSYGNWVVNRIWTDKEIPYYGFLDGEFKLTFSYQW